MDIRSAAENYKLSMQNKKDEMKRELEHSIRDAVENGHCMTYIDYMDDETIQELKEKGYTVTEEPDYKKNDDFRYRISWNMANSR